jgi:hypothetical protein
VRAERQASQVFHGAGVEVVWRNPARASTRDFWQRATNTDRQFSVHILSHSRNLSDDVFGLAFVGEDGRGQQADVFYSGMARLGARGICDPANLLGAVIAHELGHLLLGTNAHTPTGIMRKRWDGDQLGMEGLAGLTFDAEQSARVRERVASIERGSEHDLTASVGD